MMVMLPPDSPEFFLGDLKGKGVFIWTCSTCARFCGAGGREIAEETADYLAGKGVRVTGVGAVSAACFMSKAAGTLSDLPGTDVILALCCSIGADCASRASGIPVLNPVRTLGTGYLGEDGIPRLSAYK